MLQLGTTAATLHLTVETMLHQCTTAATLTPQFADDDAPSNARATMCSEENVATSSTPPHTDERRYIFNTSPSSSLMHAFSSSVALLLHRQPDRLS